MLMVGGSIRGNTDIDLSSVSIKKVERKNDCT